MSFMNLNDLRDLLREKEHFIRDKEHHIRELEGMLRDRDRLLIDKERKLDECDRIIEHLRSQLDKFQSVFSMNPTAPNSPRTLSRVSSTNHSFNGSGRRSPRRQRILGISAEAPRVSKAFLQKIIKYHPKNPRYPLL